MEKSWKNHLSNTLGAGAFPSSTLLTGFDFHSPGALRYFNDDPLRAYLLAKLEMARIEHNRLYGAEHHVQRKHSILRRRLENIQNRYEVLASILREDPRPEQVLRSLRALGIRVPQGMKDPDVLRLARWERGRAYQAITNLQSRIAHLEQEAFGKGLSFQDRLKNLEFFIDEFEKSSHFYANLPGLSAINKSNEAAILMINQAIERAVEAEDAKAQEKAIEELYRLLKGEKDRFKERTYTLTHTKKWGRSIKPIPFSTVQSILDDQNEATTAARIQKYLRLTGTPDSPGLIQQMVQRRKLQLQEGPKARIILQEIKEKQAQSMNRLRELVLKRHIGFSPDLKGILKATDDLVKIGLLTGDEALWLKKEAKRKLSVPLDDRGVLARAKYFAMLESEKGTRPVFGRALEEYLQIKRERKAAEERAGIAGDRQLFYVIRDLKAKQERLRKGLFEEGITDFESAFQYLVKEGLATEAGEESQSVTRRHKEELGPSLSSMIEEKARRLQRDEYQFEEEWKEKRQWDEEIRLLDRARAKRSRRPADTYEQILFSHDQLVSQSAKDALSGAPDPKQFVGKVIRSRTDKGIWRPLEVIDVDPSGGLVVRPLSLTLQQDAKLRVLTSPYTGILRYYKTFVDPTPSPENTKVAEGLFPFRASAAPTSVIHEIEDRSRRIRKHLENVVNEQIEDAKQRRFITSYARKGLSYVTWESKSQALAEFMGFRFGIGARRLGIEGSFRIPYRMYRLLKKDFPFFMYGKDSASLLESMITESYQWLLKNRKFWREMEFLTSRARTQPSDARAITALEEAIDRWLRVSLHKARGSVFHELLGDVVVEELGDADEYLTSLKYLQRIMEEQGVPEPQQRQRLAQILSHYRRKGVEAPYGIAPLVKASDEEIFRLWDAFSRGAAKSPLSLDMPIGEDQTSLLREVVGPEHSLYESIGRYSEGAEERLNRLSIEEAIDRRLLPEVSKRHRRQFAKLLAAYELEDFFGDAGGKSVQERILHIAEGILGRKLSPKEEESILTGGWDEIVRLAKKEPLRMYPVGSLDLAKEYEHLGIIHPGNLFLEYQGKQVAVRLAGMPDEEVPGLRLSVPSTGAQIVLSRTPDSLKPFVITPDRLSEYEIAQAHPVLGGQRAWAQGQSVSLRPPVHPRLLSDMGYSVADVLQSAKVLRRGGYVGAIDFETTGLLDHYRLLGLEDYFYPTETGMAEFRIQGSRLRKLRGEQQIVRPSEKMESWVRYLASITEEQFLKPKEKQKRLLQEILNIHSQAELNQFLSRISKNEQAARDIYQQTLRGYAALVEGPGIREANITTQRLQKLALQGLEHARREGIALADVLKGYQGMVERLSSRMGEAHIIAANAARAEGPWISHWLQGELAAPVRYHDPQPLFRMLYQDEDQYNLSHIAQRLKLRVNKSQVHTALYDAQLAARAYAKLVSDERTMQLVGQLREEDFLSIGQILTRTEGGARVPYLVQEILPGTESQQSQVVLKRLIGQPARITISGPNMGAIEQRMIGRYAPLAHSMSGNISLLMQSGEKGISRVHVSPEDARKLHRTQVEYWSDRARRDILRAFRNPSSEFFNLFTLRPGTQEFEQKLSQLLPPYIAGPGKESYRRTITSFLQGMEGSLHRRLFTNVQEMMKAGILDHGEAANITTTYLHKLGEMFNPQRRLPLRSSSFKLDIPGVGVRSIPLASPQAARRRIEDIIWRIAEHDSGVLPSRDYYDLAVRKFRHSIQTLVPEDADVDQMARAIYQHGRRLWKEGKLTAFDATAGLLPAADRGRAIRQIMELQDELLAEKRPIYERIQALQGDVFFEETPSRYAFAIAEGRASPFRPYASTKPTAKDIQAARRSIWRSIADAAFDETSPAYQTARSFLGLGQKDLAQIRLPFEVGGEFGVPLGEVTLEEWNRYVKPQLRRESGLNPEIRRNIMEFWADRMGEFLNRRTGQAPVQALAEVATGSRLGRSLGIVGIAGAAAMGLYAIGRMNMQKTSTPQITNVPPQMPQGLEIEINATRNRPVDIQSTVNSANAAIQTSLGIPLNVNVHQVDDTRAIDQRWAQEVVASALRG